MGVAQLLAKAWIVFCLFAGAHELNLAFARGEAPLDALIFIGGSVILFTAMGLLFAAGIGASTAIGAPPLVSRLKPHRLMPAFNEIVFVAFVVLSFATQTVVAPHYLDNSVSDAIQSAMLFVVPGQRALEQAMYGCTLDGGRILSAAMTWLLAIVYVASAVSRIGIAANAMRLERALRPSSFSLTTLAGVYGLGAIVAFQLLYVGTAYPLLDCSSFTDTGGAVLIGLAPLMLAYLIVAALAALRAGADETPPKRLPRI